MRSVLTFWQLPQDERDFFEFLASTGAIVAAPEYWAETPQEASVQPLAEFAGRRDMQRFSFGLAQLFNDDDIREHLFDGVVRFGRSPMSPIAIGYDRSVFHENKLTLSNLCAYFDYPAEDGASMIRKDEAFIKWAKKVFSWVRKKTPEKVMCNAFPYRATKRVKEAVESRGLEVALY